MTKIMNLEATFPAYQTEFVVELNRPESFSLVGDFLPLGTIRVHHDKHLEYQPRFPNIASHSFTLPHRPVLIVNSITGFI